MSKQCLVCLTPDKNYYPAAVFAAQRLLALGVGDHADVAIICAPQDVTSMPADPRIRVMIHDFEVLETLPLGRHITPAAYRRLLLADILPPQYKRFLYLDCDTLAVRPGLERLLALALSGAPFAAAIDMIFFKDFEDGPLTAAFRAYRQSLGFGLSEPYFNSGVLLADIEAWQALRLTEQAMAFLRDHADLCLFHDQSALNAVARDLWLPLSPRMNFMGDFLLLDLMAEIDPVVLHFVNDPKPWETERWNGPDWMRMLYTAGAMREPAAHKPLSPQFQRFRQRLMAYLATQPFADDEISLRPAKQAEPAGLLPQIP